MAGSILRENRSIAEGSEVYEKIVQLKITAVDEKMRKTDVADREQLLRIIQSIYFLSGKRRVRMCGREDVKREEDNTC